MKRFLSVAALLAAVMAEGSQTPVFEHLSTLVREQLPGVTPQQVDDAATQGLLNSLKGRVVLVGGGGGKGAAPLIATNRVFEGGFGYLRVGRIGAKLGAELRSGIESLGGGKALKGLVLDLRFANGFDYAAAARAAEVFLKDGGTLLTWEGGEAKAEPNAEAVTLPLMIVVNSQTRGAAEALASLLRASKSALVVGGATAGEGRLYREHALPDGRKVRIAAGEVRLGDGTALPAEGVTPDIKTTAPVADERKYLEDPFRTLGTAGNGDGVTVTQAPAQPRRINEADLVRMQREGIQDSDEAPPPVEKPPRKPLVRDPALAAALDLLKALSIARPLLQQ